MSKYLIFLSLIFFAACQISERNSDGKQAQRIVCSFSSYEKEVLSYFFRLLLEEESSGYTLYGEKPLSVQEFFKDELPLAINVRLIKKNSLLREGIRIWENSGLAQLDSQYVIRASKLPSADGWIDVFFINKQSFLNTINKNLPLFQYVLGPKVTSQSLLNQFLDPAQSLSSIFHEDRVLTGIILGYGMQNALHGSRLEYLHEHLNAKVSILENQKNSGTINNSPSFGFSDIQEEADCFKNEMFITTDRGKELPRLPWFAAINTEETCKLLANYQATQKRIRNVLDSPNFLQQVLVQFFGYQIELPSSQSSLEDLLLEKLKNEKHISVLIGRSIQSTLLKENATLQEIRSFVRGVLDPSGEREDLGSLLREDEGKERLLYRLGQKIGDQYRPVESLASLEEIAASIQDIGNTEVDQRNRTELIDQVNLLAQFWSDTPVPP